MPTYTIAPTGDLYTLHVDGAATNIAASREDWLLIAGAIEAGGRRDAGPLTWLSWSQAGGTIQHEYVPGYLELTRAESIALAASIREATRQATMARPDELESPSAAGPLTWLCGGCGHAVRDHYERACRHPGCKCGHAKPHPLDRDHAIPPDLARLLDELVAAHDGIAAADAPDGNHRMWQRYALDESTATDAIVAHWRARGGK